MYGTVTNLDGIIFTAVKCNDDQTVLEILAALGIGFDCASKVTAFVFIIIILLLSTLTSMKIIEY